MQGLYHLVFGIFEFGDHFGGSAGMGMNLSTTQACVTFASAGISGMGNMGGQPGSFGGMQPPQNGGQPGQMPGSDNSSGNAI